MVYHPAEHAESPTSETPVARFCSVKTSEIFVSMLAPSRRALQGAHYLLSVPPRRTKWSRAERSLRASRTRWRNENVLSQRQPSNARRLSRPCPRTVVATVTTRVRWTPMSLQEASDARKARLLALRKRKAGEAIDEECVSPCCSMWNRVVVLTLRTHKQRTLRTGYQAPDV